MVNAQIPIYHNIKCWPHSHLLLNRGDEKKAQPALQSLLIGALKSTKTRFKWPSRDREVNIFFESRVLSITFLPDDYVMVSQPGSPLTLKKKVDTVGGLVAAWSKYIEWQLQYEASITRKFFKKQPLQITISV